MAETTETATRAQTITINGVEIAHRVIGTEGPWVALVTGGRRGHDEFIPLAGKIAARGYRVLLHDRRNTGASDIRIEGTDSEEEIWVDDLHALLAWLDAAPAFVGGSSSGARVAMLLCLRHPTAVRGLLLMRVTGGPFAAGRLPENYYGQFIRAAQEGGMAAICGTPAYRERIEANPANRDRLMAIDPARFIAVLSNWRELLIKAGETPVMGLCATDLAAITAPTLVIPGNDKVHSSQSAAAAHRAIPGAALHQLPIVDQDVPLIPFEDWAPLEPEIVDVFHRFMIRVGGPSSMLAEGG